MLKNTIKNPFFRGILTIIFFSFLFAACDVGLGDMVNTEVPVIKNSGDENKPGDFLRGDGNIIWLEVIQEFGLTSVYVTVNYKDENDEKDKILEIPASYDAKEGKWYVVINTLEIGMKDGNISLTVTAIDVSNKIRTTPEIIYFVKNSPAKVELTMPTKVGSDEFNDPETLNNKLQGNPLTQGNDIIGIAQDLSGISLGYPKILFWPENVTLNSVTGLPDDPKWAVWRIMVDEEWNELAEGGLKAVQFRWPMVEMVDDNNGGWRLPVPGSDEIKELEPGNYNIKIKVMDERFLDEADYPRNKNDFITIKLIATANPIIRFNDPPYYYNGKGNFTVGITVSGANPIKQLIDGGVLARVSNNDDVTFLESDRHYLTHQAGTTNYTVSIPLNDFPDSLGGGKMGEKVLHIEATDIEGKSTIISRAFIVDTENPSMEFIEPSGFGTEETVVTSRVIFKGISEDNQEVAKIYYALGKTETAAADTADDPNADTGWHDTKLDRPKGDSPLNKHSGQTGDIRAEWSGSLSSWTWWFHDINVLCAEGANRNYYVTAAPGINCWKLPIKFKVVDVAGNVKFYDEEVIIDIEADLPKADIASHTNNQYVGGAVSINGTAMDNERIHSVEIRTAAQSDAQCGTTAEPTSWSGWSAVELIGQEGLNRGWNISLNDNGALNPPSNRDTRLVKVEVRARDAYLDAGFPHKQYGHVETLSLLFSNTVPQIGSIEIIRGSPSQITTAARESYSYGKMVSEYITISAAIKTTTPITSLILRGQEYSSDLDLFDENGIKQAYRNSSGTNPWIVNNGSNSYTLYIPLDTNNTLAAGSYKNSAANYNMDIQVYDSSTPMPMRGNAELSLQIDNFYPTAGYNGNWNAFGDYSISGSASDSGLSINVKEVNAVVVYFSRSGSLLNHRNGSAAAGLSVNNQRVRRAPINYDNNPETLSFFPNVRQSNGTFATTNSGIVINENGPISGYDGYSTNFTGTADDKEWLAIFNSANLSDGPITLHYVVFDGAGNATYYEQALYIANNRPIISRIDIGTDLNGNGTVANVPAAGVTGAIDEYMSLTIGSAVQSPDFRIRNSRFSVKINAADAAVNPTQLRYRIYNADRGASPVQTLVRGDVYTIAAAGNTNWVNYGVYGAAGTGVVFTATVGGTIAGTGTVYAYTKGTQAAEVLTVDAEIQYNTLGGDSPKTGGIINAKNARYIIVKVYDNTVSGDEAQSLSHAAVIALDIENNDAQAPAISVNPFHWNNASDNSLFENSKANGHIELEADLLSPGFAAAQTGVRDLDPKVSGKVSFRGRSFDNVNIGTIYFRIDKHTNGITNATATIGGNTYYPAGVFGAGSWTPQDRFSVNGWKFVIERETFNQEGHTVDWRIDFDSRFIGSTVTVAGTDNIFSIAAADKTPNTTTPGAFAQTTGASKTAHYRFDVVPYISGIETAVRNEGGLKDNNIRSADGKYSIVQGSNSSFITVKGFNLPNNTADSVRILDETRNTAFIANPGSVPTGTGVTNFTLLANAFANDRTSFTMTNASARSGYLTVVVNSIGSLNNINNNDARESAFNSLSASDGARQEQMPNREADRNVTKNILLTDDRYLQFYATKKTGIDNGYYPTMLMNKDNPVFGYLRLEGGPAKDGKPFKTNAPNLSSDNSVAVAVEHGAGTGPFSFHQNAAAQRAEFIYNTGGTRYIEYVIKSSTPDQMAIAVDDAVFGTDGGRYGHYTLNNNSFHGSSEYVYDRFGELWERTNTVSGGGINTVTGWTSGNVASGASNASVIPQQGNDPTNTAMSFEARGATVNGGRGGDEVNAIWYPKLIMKGNSITGFAANYLAYYDDYDKSIIFRTFRVGTQASVGGTNRLSSATPQFDNYGRQYNSFVNHNANARVTTGRNYAVNGNASKYFDMKLVTSATTTNNRIVIVYFDDAAARLKLAYSAADINGTQTTNNSVTFTASNIVLPDSIGMYVSMFIDSSGRIHIAAFDYANNQLQYIFIPAYNSTTYTSVTVDQFGTPGHWTDIKVNSAGVPYIAYYNAMESGSRDSIKIAFAKNAVTSAANVQPGVDANGYTTGNWEYRTIPALDPPRGGHAGFQKVNLGFMTDSRPMLGYLGAYLEFSYPVGE